MRLSSAAFNRHLRHLGQSFVWRRSYACPCVSAHSGAADLSCSNCYGKGRIWSHAVPGEAGLVSREKMRNFAAFGEWDSDDIMLSIPSDSAFFAMGQFDRVTALNRSEPFSFNVVSGINSQLLFSIISVERVFWLVDGEIVEGALPAVHDGDLVWSFGAPPAGVTYSITGRRIPEYFCYQELPTDRPLHYGEKLPRRVVLRRFDLFNNG